MYGCVLWPLSTVTPLKVMVINFTVRPSFLFEVNADCYVGTTSSMPTHFEMNVITECPHSPVLLFDISWNISKSTSSKRSWSTESDCSNRFWASLRVSGTCSSFSLQVGRSMIEEYSDLPSKDWGRRCIWMHCRICWTYSVATSLKFVLSKSLNTM